ncbi:hypothetical protein ACGFNU_44255 [Spirillospora sp. NPDC048911]|uniref:hypothetical protein n=1 Tax=Spirillospora sp. NPDC048911 TaxID=3364527 RepID=UPI00371B6E09
MTVLKRNARVGLTEVEAASVDDLCNLNVRIFTAVWGSFAAMLLAVSMTVTWLSESRFTYTEKLSVWALDLSPYPLDSPLPQALVATAALSALAASRPSVLTAALATLSAAIAAVLEVQLITRLEPADDVRGGVWLAASGLVIVLALFAPRAWYGWRTRPRQADRYPDVDPRPGRDPRR